MDRVPKSWDKWFSITKKVSFHQKKSPEFPANSVREMPTAEMRVANRPVKQPVFKGIRWPKDQRGKPDSGAIFTLSSSVAQNSGRDETSCSRNFTGPYAQSRIIPSMRLHASYKTLLPKRLFKQCVYLCRSLRYLSTRKNNCRVAGLIWVATAGSVLYRFSHIRTRKPPSVLWSGFSLDSRYHIPSLCSENP